MRKAVVAVFAIALMLMVPLSSALDAEDSSNKLSDPSDSSDLLMYVLSAIADTPAVLELTDDPDQNKKILTERLNEIISRVVSSFVIDENNFEALASLLAGFPVSKLIATHLLPQGNAEFSIGHFKAGFDLPQPMREAFDITKTGEGSDSRYGELGLVMMDTVSVDVTTFKDIDHLGGMQWAGSVFTDNDDVIFTFIVADNPKVLYGKDVEIKTDAKYRVDNSFSLYIYIGMNAEYDEENDQLDMRVVFSGYGSIDQNMNRISGVGPDYVGTKTVARDITADLNVTIINPSSNERTIFIGINDFDLDFFYELDVDGDFESTELKVSSLTSLLQGASIRAVGDATLKKQKILDYDQDLVNTASSGRSAQMNDVIAEAKEGGLYIEVKDHSFTYIIGAVLASIGVATIALLRYQRKY